MRRREPLNGGLPTLRLKVALIDSIGGFHLSNMIMVRRTFSNAFGQLRAVVAVTFVLSSMRGRWRVWVGAFVGGRFVARRWGHRGQGQYHHVATVAQGLRRSHCRFIERIPNVSVARSHAMPGARSPGVPWRLLASPGVSCVSWRVLACPGVSCRVLACHGVSWRRLASSGVAWRHLASASCRPRLTACIFYNLLCMRCVYGTRKTASCAQLGAVSFTFRACNLHHAIIWKTF